MKHLSKSYANCGGGTSEVGTIRPDEVAVHAQEVAKMRARERAQARLWVKSQAGLQACLPPRLQARLQGGGYVLHATVVEIAGQCADEIRGEAADESAGEAENKGLQARSQVC